MTGLDAACTKTGFHAACAMTGLDAACTMTGLDAAYTVTGLDAACTMTGLVPFAELRESILPAFALSRRLSFICSLFAMLICDTDFFFNLGIVSYKGIQALKELHFRIAKDRLLQLELTVFVIGYNNLFLYQGHKLNFYI